MAYKDPVEARVKGAAASPAIQAEAERLLPCANFVGGCSDGQHLEHTCPAYYRPAVVSALQAKQDQIDDLEATLSALTKGLEPITDKLISAAKSGSDGIPHLEAYGIDTRAAIVGAGRILAKQVIDRDERIKVLEAALRSVQDLISMSRGVVGLHLNDEASWDELLRGGQFGGWLGEFSDAIPPAPTPDHSVIDEMLARTALGEQKDKAE